MVANAPQGVVVQQDARHVLGAALVTEVIMPLLPDVRAALKKQLSKNLTDLKTSMAVIDLAMKLLDKGFMKEATGQEVADVFRKLTNELEAMRVRTSDQPDGAGVPTGPLRWPSNHLGPEGREKPPSA